MNEQSKTIAMSSKLIFIIAITCGALVANLYYAQTLTLMIAKTVNLPLQLLGFIVTLSQIGYGLGLLFIVPLADIVENKKLILSMLAILIVGLSGLLFAQSLSILMSTFFMIGVSASAAQIIVPFVTHFTPLESRGKVTGTVMSGLLFGIMLARPLASFVAGFYGWKTIFVISLILITLLFLILYTLLPNRKPEHKASYNKLIASLPTILRDYPALRRRAAYHAVLFGVFSLFWTAIATHLINDFHFTQTFVAGFAFIGAAGAFAAPYAGKLADMGLTRFGTGIAIICVISAVVLSYLHFEWELVSLIIAAVLLDVGVSFNLVLGQRTIYALAPNIRGRLNGLYMAIFFMGGAIGSALSGYLYTIGQWHLTMKVAIIASSIIFMYFLTELNLFRKK